MSTELMFPALPTKNVMGWNLRQRIKYKTGATVHYDHDDRRTCIFCDVDLTEEQKKQIAEIVSDARNAFGPDPALVLPGNSIVIRDIFNYKGQVEKRCGFRFQLYNRQTKKFRGSGEQDEILIVPCTDDYQLKRQLSKDEIKVFFDAYKGLGRIE